MNRIVVILLFISFSFISCIKNEDYETEVKVNAGTLTFDFKHTVDNMQLQKDTMLYYNAAGNKYSISEIKYFISEVVLYHNGQKFTIQNWKWQHYVDIDIPSTLTWQVFDKIDENKYDSLAFIFGIRSEKNKSFMFVNPPEVNMMWPDVLGGGYHYLMINGKWKKPDNSERFFNFHLGIGQIYDGTTFSVDSIKRFVDNSFRVSFPKASFRMVKDKNIKLIFTMNLNSWFTSPNIYNHDYWGGDIMQKQSAMQAGKENGYDVFSIQIDSSALQK